MRKTGAGHWHVVVEQEYWSRKGAARVTSIKRWEHTTTNSMAVDDYHSEDCARSRRGERALLRQAKWFGMVEYVKME